MTEKKQPGKKPKPKRSWTRRIFRALVALVMLLILLAGAGVAVLELGWFDSSMRNAVIKQIEQVSGGTVELKRFHFAPLALRVELTGLTVHGREPEGTPPLFHADLLIVRIQVDSFWHKKVSLRELRILKPEVHIRFNADGTSNIPPPRTPNAPSDRPLRVRLFEFAIHHLQLDDGTILYNDVRVPLVAEGDNFNLAVDWGQARNAPIYVGKLTWDRFTLVANRNMPFAAGVSLKFAISAEAFHVEQLQLKLPHSNFDVQADIEPLATPALSFRWRGMLDFLDIEEIFRKPTMPGGKVDFGGSGTFKNEEWKATGHYAAREINLPYDWFHSGGITTRGDFQIAHNTMVVPNFEATALGGTMHGRVNLDFKGLLFRVESHSTGMSVGTVLNAIANKNLPVETFHWDGAMGVDALSTWARDFKHFASQGTTDWTTAAVLPPGKIPATAHIEYDYSMDRNGVVLHASKIETPTTTIIFGGTLGGDDSALDVGLTVTDMLPWDDFINRLRGEDAAPERIAGRATWQGKLTGPLVNPTFAGHVHAFDASYGTLYWDEAEGDLTYSSTGFQFARAHARRGNSAAQFDLSLELDEWAYLENAKWNMDADVSRTPLDGLQQMFGLSFPVHGLLTGGFHGRGTHGDPQLTGVFEIAELNAWGWSIDRARGQLTLDHNEVRIANGELRLTPLGAAGGRAPSLLTGNIGFRFADANINFDLTGAVIPIQEIRQIQTPRMPLSGDLSFQLHGSGPLLAPAAQGTVRLVDLRAGQDLFGSFEGKLDSDGKTARLDLNSALPADRLRGHFELALTGDMPIFGELEVKGMDPDPLIRAGLHLEGITGSSSMDGHFKLTGALLKQDSISMDVNLTHLAMDYAFMKLENKDPIQITYRKNEVRIEHANLTGSNTDFHISGFARFAGDRTLGLKLIGAVDLRLLAGFVPRLKTSGAANVNASIDGTLAAPRINGRMEVTNASANYDDFPAGLSNVTGAFVFDASRLTFENVRAETGGGELVFGGSLSYGDGFGAMRYDITTRATNVRIRYPVGMSWLTSGSLRFSGSTQAATLSGSVTVHRLLLAQGFDLAALLVSNSQAVRAPTTSSPFLRNLQFDIQAKSSPDARVEWSSASFESEANLRVRGTWENPILLGRISLLNGELSFAGNRYRLSRGDIDFTNPFRLDPVLNVQATTTVQQYEVTLDISGPASRLAMSYRSDPPLPTTDIINLLALGQATESTAYRGSTAAQTPQSGATSLLSEAISSQLGGRLEKLFGITRFRVDPFLAGTTNAQNGAARVTIEERVGNHLAVTYATNVAGAQEEVVQVEYIVRPDISIVALRDFNGTFSLDVVFKKRFK